MTEPGRRGSAAFAVAAAVNLAMLYWPQVDAPAGLPYVDKLAHAVSFAALAWTGCHVPLPRRWLGPLLAVHGVVSEVVQHLLLAQRSGDAADVVADVIGVGLGLIGGTWSYERAGDRRRTGRSPSGGQPGAR